MEYRTLELNITSANDLKYVNLFSKMDMYAVVSVSGDPKHKPKAKTPVHRDGGTNPVWNFPIKLTLNQSLLHQNRLILEIKLRSKRTLAGDKDVGHVIVPLKELLLGHAGDGKSFRHVSYQVRKTSGKPKGALNFFYKFGEIVAAPPIPATLNPPAGGSNSAPYAARYRYRSQPRPGNGYRSKLGYRFPQAPRPGKNNFGMGLGVGLLGGALGGLLIGDMFSGASAHDAGFDDGGYGAGFEDSGYDGGYDAGFDDGQILLLNQILSFFGQIRVQP